MRWIFAFGLIVGSVVVVGSLFWWLRRDETEWSLKVTNETPDTILLVGIGGSLQTTTGYDFLNRGRTESLILAKGSEGPDSVLVILEADRTRSGATLVDPNVNAHRTCTWSELKALEPLVIRGPEQSCQDFSSSVEDNR